MSACHRSRAWVNAMNREPMFVNFKNFYTPQFRAMIATPWEQTVISTHGNNESYAGTTAMRENAVQCACSRPYPSYNAAIPIADYPTY